MAKQKNKMTKKQKREFSKAICTIAFVLFSVIGVWMIYRYFSLMELAISTNSVVMPDASLPIAGITFILAPVGSYLLYQLGLKNSRNKYGVDEYGEPYARPVE